MLQFKEIRNSDVGLVGGKNASLGEMVRKTRKKTKKTKFPHFLAFS